MTQRHPERMKRRGRCTANFSLSLADRRIVDRDKLKFVGHFLRRRL